MKINRLFALLASAAVFAVSCQEKEPVPDNNNNGGDDEEKPVVKSDKCKLESLTVIGVSGTEYETTLWTNDKVAELSYFPDNCEDLTAVTFKWTVSEKATVDVAEDAVYNLLEDIPTITITAEDGEHSAKWTVEAVEAKVVVAAECVYEGVPSTFGLTYNSTSGASVAFCGTDKIANINGGVYDFEGNFVGNLNYEGLPAKAKMFNITNDVNGVIIGGFCFDEETGDPILNNDICRDKKGTNYIYCWKDGYDKAPTLIYTTADKPKNERNHNIGYLNCGGDVNGDLIVTTIFEGRSPTAQSYHTFTYHNGDFSKVSWAGFHTDYPGNDGDWFGVLSPASGDINGTFFLLDSEGDNHGMQLYVREGVAKPEGGDLSLEGTVTDITDKEHSGTTGYGNYSTGNIKAFIYNGIPCVAVASTGWPSVYLTIQTCDPTDEDSHYILRTQVYPAAATTPSTAYVYDPATDTGHVLLLGGLDVIARYEIKRTVI